MLRAGPADGLAVAPEGGGLALARAVVPEADGLALARAIADVVGALWPGSMAMGIAISPPAMIALTCVFLGPRGILMDDHPTTRRVIL